MQVLGSVGWIGLDVRVALGASGGLSHFFDAFLGGNYEVALRILS